MGKVMRHTLGASLNIRHNLSSSKGPKPLQLKLLTTYIPKTSAFTLAFSTSQRLRTTRASARTFFTFRHYITPAACNFFLFQAEDCIRAGTVTGVQTCALPICAGARRRRVGGADRDAGGPPGRDPRAERRRDHRSEERRAGNERRARWTVFYFKK